jgi:hypothetical protein
MLIDVAFCPVLPSPVGAAGVVDCVRANERTLSPCALIATTSNEYDVPPDSPVIVVATDDEPVPSYATSVAAVSAAPSLRYTL